MAHPDPAAALRRFKQQHWRELCDRYGAHSVGIGRKRVAGRKSERLALIFYVARKADDLPPGIEAVPPTITCRPDGGGEAVTFPTDVVETEPAQPE